MTTSQQIVEGSPSGLAAYKESCHLLSGVASRLAAVFTKLGIDSRSEELDHVVQKLDADRFRILVLGEMKRGKSTLINALLGQEVLPAAAIPCTAVIQEIKWGEQPRALLHFRHPAPALPLVRLPSDVKAHLSRAGDGPAPPLEVPVTRLADYVAIPDSEAADTSGRTAELPYAKVEIFWPLALCRNGIEIIDSPGLNENALRARIAREYIAEVDAVLFVLTCSALAGATEMRVIDHDLRDAGHEYLFFVCNRFDEVPPRERGRLEAFGEKKLVDHTALGKEGVCFVSGQQALDGRLRGDQALVAESGVPVLEEALLRFLSRDRGKVKLLQPTLKLLHALDEMHNRILPAQCEMLVTDLAALESKVEAVRPQLDELEHSRDQIVAEVERHRERLHGDVRSEAEVFLRGVARSVAGWVEELEIENGVKILSLQYREQIEALAAEICAKTSVRLETEIIAWKDRILLPLVDARMGAMVHDTDLRVGTFCAQIDRIRSAVSQVELPPREVQEPSKSERVLAAIGGFLVAGIHSGAYGARFGFKGLGSVVLTHLAILGVLNLLGFSIPVIGTILFSAGLGINWIRAGALTREAKQEIARRLEAQLQEDAATLAQGISQGIDEQTAELAHSASEGLDREIRSLREQLEAILADKKAGEAKVQEKKKLLVEAELELRAIDSELRARLAASVDGSETLVDARRSGPKDQPEAPAQSALRILFLTADPFTGLRQGLRLPQELRAIREKLREARLNDRFEVEWEPAVRPEDFTRALQEFAPDIVHFSGHGDEDGAILVEGQEGVAQSVTPHALAGLFSLVADRVQCVVLNACYSNKQAQAISRKIRYVIGMQKEVEDRAAITFSIGFYQALGDGRPIEKAFAYGRTLVEMYSFADFRTPVLWKDGKFVRGSGS
jgi:GTPase SAR1 family protein